MDGGWSWVGGSPAEKAVGLRRTKRRRRQQWCAAWGGCWGCGAITMRDGWWQWIAPASPRCMPQLVSKRGNGLGPTKMLPLPVITQIQPEALPPWRFYSQDISQGWWQLFDLFASWCKSDFKGASSLLAVPLHHHPQVPWGMFISWSRPQQPPMALPPPAQAGAGGAASLLLLSGDKRDLSCRWPEQFCSLRC